MSDKRELGDLQPVRSVLEWLDKQTDSIAAPPESVRLITEVRRKLSDALTDAERPTLPAEGVTVEEYAALHELKTSTVYKRIRRGQLEAKRIGRDIRIPIAA